jgi:hypothetical protein
VQAWQQRYRRPWRPMIEERQAWQVQQVRQQRVLV